MGKRNKEFYISVDVEANGPCPGINSMWQFGSVFYDSSGETLFEYSVNLEDLENAVGDPDTMDWWAEQDRKNPGILQNVRSNLVAPKLAMERFESAVKKFSFDLKAAPLVIAYPAGFDFTFTYYYLCKFLGKSCVGFSALDIKTLAMSLLNRTYHDSAKKRFPASWFNPEFKHTHDALEDARGQGYTFFRMLDALGVLHARALSVKS